MSVTQASGALNFTAAQVGNLTLRALDSASGAIVLGPLAGSGTLDVRAARGLDLGGAVTVADNAKLVAGWDGNETPTPALRGDGIGSLLVGQNFSNSGPTAETRLWAEGDIALSAGRTLSGYDILIGGGRDMNLAGTVSAGRYLAATAKRDITVGGSLLAQSLIVSAGRDLTVSGNVALTPTGYYLDLGAGADYDIVADDWLPSVSGGDLTLTASSVLGMTEAGHALYLSALQGNERSGHVTQQAGGSIVLPSQTQADIDATGMLQLSSVAAGAGSIANLRSGYNWDTASFLGTARDLSLGSLAFAAGTVNAQATGAIVDANGAAPNVVADSIDLTSRLGGAAGGHAIDLDVVAGAAAQATVNAGSANGGIYLRNLAVSAPPTLVLTDGATNQPTVAFYHDGDLALGAGHTFDAGSGTIGVAAGGSLSGVETARFGGAPAQLGLFADQDLSLSNALVLPSTHVGLSATGTLDIGHTLGALHLAANGGTVNIGATVGAAGDIALGAGVLNVNGIVSGQNIALGASTLNVGGSGGIHASQHLAASVGGNAQVTGGYLKSGGDLELLVGGNLTVADEGHLWAGYGQMSPPFADASIAVGGNLTLENGAYIIAANDVYLDLLGPSSVLSLAGGLAGPSYVLSDFAIGMVGTTHIAFAQRNSGGILIDGVETASTVVGGSGFFAVDTNTPARPGFGLEIGYASQAGDSVAAQLVTAIEKAIENAATDERPIEEGGSPQLGGAAGGESGPGFGDEEEQKDKDKVGQGKDGKDPKKDDKPARRGWPSAPRARDPALHRVPRRAAGAGSRPAGRPVWSLCLRHPPHQVELVVRPHRGHVGHTVAEAEEGRNGTNVPDVLVAEAVSVQRFEVGIGNRGGVERHFHGEIQHGLLARRDVGLAMIDRNLVGDQRVLGTDAQDGAVRDHAILATVGIRGGDYDHLAFRLGQPTLLFHQRIVKGEERAPFRGPVRQREKHVGNEAGLLLHLQDAGADVFGQVFEFRYGVAADRRRAHGLLVSMAGRSGHSMSPL
jgi:hypothetical protein